MKVGYPIKSNRKNRCKLDKPNCHFPNCDRKCKNFQWACVKCWMTLPRYLQLLIFEHYVLEMEMNSIVSSKYLEVEKEVRDWINAQHNNDSTTRLQDICNNRRCEVDAPEILDYSI